MGLFLLPFLKTSFWDNVIIDEDCNTSTIIDFEESIYYYRIFDIGMTIVGICGVEKIANLERIKHLLNGYQSEVQLLEDEINSLKAFTIYAGASMTFWRHQNFNFIKANSKISNYYMGLKVLVDDVFKQTDDCFVELFKKLRLLTMCRHVHTP